MAVVWIAPLTDATAAIEPEAVTQSVRRHASAVDRLEHVRVRAGPDGLIVFGFLVADTEDHARTTLRRLVERAIAATPELRLWRVI